MKTFEQKHRNWESIFLEDPRFWEDDDLDDNGEEMEEARAIRAWEDRYGYGND